MQLPVNSLKMDFSSLLMGFGAGLSNCSRYFEDRVHPLLASSFPDLRIEYQCGSHCARVYFGRSRVYEGTRYDGILIGVSPDRYGNRCQDHGGSTHFTPRCIEGVLLMEDSLQHDKDFSWFSLEDMVSGVKSLNGE